MADQVITATILPAPAGVAGTPTRNGKTKFTVKTAEGQEWVTFDPNLAMKAGQLQGQPATLTVNIAPSADGRFTNYYLNDIGPSAGGGAAALPVGATATTPPASDAALAAAGVTMAAPAAGGGARVARGPQTLGQGGSFTDADLMRMARTSGVTSACVLFQGKNIEDIDPQQFWALAESFSKFALLRKHEWLKPGLEILPAGVDPSDVVATVNAAAGEEVVTQGVAEEQTPEPAAASAAQATGGDVVWD